MRLPERQAAVLEATSAEPTPTAQITETTGLAPETVTRAAMALTEEGLLTLDERTDETVTLTEEGTEYLTDGLPEVRLYRAAREAGADDVPVDLGAVIGAADLGDRTDIALANYARKGYGEIDAGAVTANSEVDPDSDAEAAAIEAIDRGDAAAVDADILDRLESRELIRREETVSRMVALTDEGLTAVMAGVDVTETVSELTPEMLTTGEWRDVEFADYDVEADAETVSGGKVHVLRDLADRVKDVFVGMGFREMEGPHADADFWIHDCLFMPQDHPARTHWDRFELAEPTHVEALPADLVDRVRSAHLEGVGPDGDGYHSPWSEEFARRLALRGHTTSLSMRYLSSHAAADVTPPERYFSVEKVYRNDTLDPTHLLEFFQIEGWVLAEDLSVRDLMGTFTEFYEQFGITDLQFKPTYNPYTEPSAELFGEHPETGDLIEIGNSGMFRDEVLRPLGVEADVMAWGLALERLLMLIYGFEDIRDVHGTLCDLQLLRETEVMH